MPSHTTKKSVRFTTHPPAVAFIPEELQTWGSDEFSQPPPLWMEIHAQELTNQALVTASAEEEEEVREDYFTTAHRTQIKLVQAAASSPRLVSRPVKQVEEPQPHCAKRKPLPTYAHIPRNFVPVRAQTNPLPSNTRPRLQRTVTAHQFEHVVKVVYRKAVKVVEERVKGGKR
jgi:hypothetical protein